MKLTSSSHEVRSPIAIRPVGVAAPSEVVLGAGNAVSYSIKSGVPDPITLGKRGLIPAVTDNVTLSDDPDDSFDTTNPDSNPAASTFKKTIVVPAGQSVLRVSTFDVDTDGNDDLDIYLYRGSTLIAISGEVTAEEVVTVRNPTAATYHAYIHAFQTDGPDVDFTLFSWLLGTADAGNMTVNGPFVGAIGQTHTVNVTTAGLTPGTRYLGQVTYSAPTAGFSATPTIVSGKAS
jgi:hypothetical protein